MKPVSLLVPDVTTCKEKHRKVRDAFTMLKSKDFALYNPLYINYVTLKILNYTVQFDAVN